MAKRRQAAQQQQYPWEEIEGATGAGDASSGGGSGSGTPDAETAMRVGDRVARAGNVEQDKRKLFPERFAKKPGAKAKAGGAMKAPGAKRSATARKAGKAKTSAARKRSK